MRDLQLPRRPEVCEWCVGERPGRVTAVPAPWRLRCVNSGRAVDQVEAALRADEAAQLADPQRVRRHLERFLHL